MLWLGQARLGRSKGSMQRRGGDAYARRALLPLLAMHKDAVHHGDTGTAEHAVLGRRLSLPRSW